MADPHHLSVCQAHQTCRHEHRIWRQAANLVSKYGHGALHRLLRLAADAEHRFRAAVEVSVSDTTNRPESLTALAEQAYLAYGETVGFKNYRGDAMPAWADLGEPIQTAWRQAAVCAYTAGQHDAGNGLPPLAG